jgi:hypothetical protein
MTDTHENTLLNHMFGGATYTNPATWYVVLFTATPGEAGGGTECSGGAYVRKAITNNTTNFPTTTTGEKNLGVSIAFLEATTNWGTITAVGLSDSVTAGAPVQFYAPLDTAQTINAGDIFRIAAGSSGLRILLD